MNVPPDPGPQPPRQQQHQRRLNWLGVLVAVYAAVYGLVAVLGVTDKLNTPIGWAAIAAGVAAFIAAPFIAAGWAITAVRRSANRPIHGMADNHQLTDSLRTHPPTFGEIVTTKWSYDPRHDDSSGSRHITWLVQHSEDHRTNPYGPPIINAYPVRTRKLGRVAGEDTYTTITGDWNGPGSVGAVNLSHTSGISGEHITSRGGHVDNLDHVRYILDYRARH